MLSEYSLESSEDKYKLVDDISACSDMDIPVPDIVSASNDSILSLSVKYPKVLIGWNVIVKSYGPGTIITTEKKPFSRTKFKIQFESGKTELLHLKRGHKGQVPFVLVSKSSKY